MTEQVRAEGATDDDAWRTALIHGSTFRNRPVQYQVIDGMAVVEGDIVLGRAEVVERRTEQRRRDEAEGASVVVSGDEYRWPGAVIPYDVDPDLPDQDRVSRAIEHWEASTHLRFPLRTEANAQQYPNWIHFFPGPGCFSPVGMQGGRQDISLGSGCLRGQAIHEIGHSVGLWHEQSREDRDDFVTIHFAEIDPSRIHNFDQQITDGDDVGAYDYGSIMHYPRNAFSITGNDTITPLTEGVSIGQRTALSPSDIAAVRTIYPPQADAALASAAADAPRTTTR